MTGETTIKAGVPWITLGVAALLTIVPLVVFLQGELTARLVILALVGAAGAAYAATVHPLSIFVALAVVLGAVPYMHVPFSPMPLLLVLSAGVWVALVFLPGVEFRPGWVEVWVALLAVTALMSLAATELSVTALVEYAAWLAATAIVVPLRFLPADARALTFRTFAISTAVGSSLALLIKLEPHPTLFNLLTIVGYDRDRNVRYVIGSDSVTTRLSGSFLEPNIAGLILAAGMLLTVAYFTGLARITLVTLIGLGLLLTLSRSAILTLIIAGLLVVFRTRVHRLTVIVAGAVAGLAAFALPAVRTRLLDSFGPSDYGTLERALALQDFPRVMAGHWVWGLGWAREEFRSPTLGRAVNYVANAPLMTIYRGGVILGALVLVMIIVLAIRSWHAARFSFEDAVVCCGVIAFIVCAMQLDFPITLQAPATAVFSFLVAASLTRVLPTPPPDDMPTDA